MTELTDEPTDALTVSARLRRLTPVLLGEPPCYTSGQVADLIGVEVSEFSDLWRSLGFATPALSEVMFTRSDVDALKLALDLHESPGNLEFPFARAFGQSMARMAEWQADLLRELSSHHQKAAPRGTTIHASEAAFERLLPSWEQLQQHLWRRHLHGAVARLISRPVPASPETVTTVGFADMAGYTSTSRGLSPARLQELIEGFAVESSLVVTDRGGQVVKTIGDEVMFAVDDPVAGADIALTLAQRLSKLDGRPELHLGMAYGPVVRHFGDYYGTVVNLASRLTDLAQPGTVLVDDTLAANLGAASHLHLRRLSAVAMRGFPQLTPWLLRRSRSG